LPFLSLLMLLQEEEGNWSWRLDEGGVETWWGK
jgi:hypothetical protein